MFVVDWLIEFVGPFDVALSTFVSCLRLSSMLRELELKLITTVANVAMISLLLCCSKCEHY